MDLTEFFADDLASRQAFADLENAVHATDAPWEHLSTVHRVEMRMRYGWDGEVGRYFLARVDDVPLGWLQINTSNYDNLDLAWIHFSVHPEHRRNGHGTTILNHAVDLCVQGGRPLIGVSGWDSDATTGFMKANGWEQKAKDINRRMHMADVDLTDVARLRDEAAEAAADYELIRIAGRTPEELMDALAQSTAAINDAPLDDLEYEDEVFTADRIRAYEAAQVDSGERLYRIIARHLKTGELGGLSVVAVDSEQPANGEQHDTSVVRSHRGHRLGLLLKADMVQWLAESEPQLATIDTWNAESNRHMISVNEQLGYRVMGRELSFQRRF